MTVLRNGKASLAQLLVHDMRALTTFTIPDTGLNSPGGVANATNSFAGGIWTDGRYQAITVGSATDVEAATQTGLGAEYTTIGLTRRAGTDVRTYLVNDEGAGAWIAAWETTFTVSGTGDVNELGVANKSGSKAGLHLMRQKLPNTLKAVAGDLLNVLMKLRVPGSNVVSAPPANQIVVTFEGLREICRIAMYPTTTRSGEGGAAGDWETDYTIGGVAARVSQQFDVMGIGSLGIARTLARTDTALAAEHTTADLARRIDGGVGDLRGTLMQAPAVSPPGTVWNGLDPGNESTSFGADTFTTFAGDTAQWAARWDLSATRTTNEVGVFNGAVLASNPGVMLMESVEVDNLVGDANLTIIRIHRLVVV